MVLNIQTALLPTGYALDKLVCRSNIFLTRNLKTHKIQNEDIFYPTGPYFGIYPKRSRKILADMNNTIVPYRMRYFSYRLAPKEGYSACL